MEVFAGDESDEYSRNPDNFTIWSLNDICNLDATILGYAEAKEGQCLWQECKRGVAEGTVEGTQRENERKKGIRAWTSHDAGCPFWLLFLIETDSGVNEGI